MREGIVHYLRLDSLSGSAVFAFGVQRAVQHLVICERQRGRETRGQPAGTHRASVSARVLRPPPALLDARLQLLHIASEAVAAIKVFVRTFLQQSLTRGSLSVDIRCERALITRLVRGAH